MLSENDFLESLTFADTSWHEKTKRTTICIDSIIIIEAGEFDFDNLSFGDKEALSLVWSGIGPQIVDDPEATDGKVLQITFKNDNVIPSGRVDATIDLGSVYKVSEIESIVISVQNCFRK